MTGHGFKLCFSVLLQNTLPNMNRADVTSLQAAFAYQSEMLKNYQEQLTKLQSVNEHLTPYIRSLPPPTPLTVSFALPEKFDAQLKLARGSFIKLSYISITKKINSRWRRRNVLF